MNPLKHFIKRDIRSHNNENWDTAEYQNKLSEESDYKNMTDKERYEYNANNAMAEGRWVPSYEDYLKKQKEKRRK